MLFPFTQKIARMKIFKIYNVVNEEDIYELWLKMASISVFWDTL